MDITGFTIGNRDSALLIGDYNAYRAQLSRQLVAVRRRLGRATAKNAKFQKKAPVAAEDIGHNHEFAHLLLLSSERAWAHAMHMKSTHTEDGQGITGSTRAHIISRLHKASNFAKELAGLLQDSSASHSTDDDVLEAKAYQASLAGAEQFERESEGQKTKEELADNHRWDKCLYSFAMARVVYASLYRKTAKDVFRDILANTVDPTIRYVSYQARLSRSIAVSTVAIRYFPKDETKVAESVKRLDPDAFTEQTTVTSTSTEGQAPTATGEIPNTVTWRSRKANIVDASIGQALAQAYAGEARLKSFLSSNPDASAKDKASAYDDVLLASQDATDATKRAIDELEKDRVDEGDARMQDLRVTSLAVNYGLVSWRVGRNRVLIGRDDGLMFGDQRAKKTKRARTARDQRDEPRAKKLARLRERVVLYDATIQSIDSVKALRGAMRDNAFVQELERKSAYFQALKCLNIATSHTLLSNHLNALALLSRAATLAEKAISSDQSSTSAPSGPPSLEIDSKQTEALRLHLRSEIHRHQALADLEKFHANAIIAQKEKMTSAAPLVQRLNDFPTPGTFVDLTNLVTYPPKIEPVPVKPLFLDVAWNYIDYPGRAKRAVEEVSSSAVIDSDDEVEATGKAAQPSQEKKRGWFGFGR